MDKRIEAVLPLRPSILRELIEELHDLSKAEAREMLRKEVDSGYLSLGWDGKIHSTYKRYDPTEVSFA